MPEGPEIKLAADKVAEAIVGRVAREVYFAFEHLKPFERMLSGQWVSAVEARGKAMLIRFANGLNIYSHNQLYGRWVIRRVRDFPETNRQLRLAIHTDRKSALLYSASDIEVLADDALADHDFLGKLGPNPLDEAVTVEQIRARFEEPRFRRRQLASLLLDQAFLAGLGNYLRSEILFVAGVHPAMRPIDCTPAQLDRLAEAALILPRQSYRTRGITNDLALVEQLRQQGLRRDQYRFRIFNREGGPCFVCESPVVRETRSGRRCYICPTCQAR